jgi:N-acetylmuramoyl-L-alanine amidase
LRFGDYHVLRITSMPAILIENAYMILPQHEEMLLNEDFKELLARTLAEGIINFIYDR